MVVLFVVTACGGQTVSPSPGVAPPTRTPAAPTPTATPAPTPSPGGGGDAFRYREFRGTWDYVHNEAARDGILDDFAGLVDSADEVATRMLGG